CAASRRPRAGREERGDPTHTHGAAPPLRRSPRGEGSAFRYATLCRRGGWTAIPVLPYKGFPAGRARVPVVRPANIASGDIRRGRSQIVAGDGTALTTSNKGTVGARHVRRVARTGGGRPSGEPACPHRDLQASRLRRLDRG